MSITRTRRGARCHAVGALAGCALLVLVVSSGLPAVAAGHPAPSLGRVVIPNVGPSYTVTSQGSLNPSQFASDDPDPPAAARALATLGTSISTYERVWQADGGLNQVQNLLVRFPDAAGAQVFLRAARHSLQSGEIVSSDALPPIPGARRVTYFAATHEDGVGEAITMRAGAYVDLLSFFSAASGNARPMSPADAERVAKTQFAAVTQAPGADATPAAAPTAGTKKGLTVGTIVVAVLVVAVLALAVATPALLRRRRLAQDSASSTPRPATPSGGDARDDLRQHSG